MVIHHCPNAKIVKYHTSGQFLAGMQSTKASEASFLNKFLCRQVIKNYHENTTKPTLDRGKERIQSS
jgi:hypothetical protein